METEHWLAVGGGALMIGMVGLAIASSVPKHEATTAPDGAPAILVTCSSPAGCISESAVACPHGYRVLSADAKRGSITTYTNVGVGSGTSVGMPSTHDTYSGATLIRCGAQ